MIVTRNGARLQCVPESGIGQNLTFSHTCERECDAVAWQAHFDQRQRASQEYDRVREIDRRASWAELEARIATLQKSNAALRGCLRRERRQRTL